MVNRAGIIPPAGRAAHNAGDAALPPRAGMALGGIGGRVGGPEKPCTSAPFNLQGGSGAL